MKIMKDYEKEIKLDLLQIKGNFPLKTEERSGKIVIQV